MVLFGVPTVESCPPADYQLAHDSPAIDRAVTSSVTNDLTGTVRPLDGNHDGHPISDLGAFEYDPARTDSGRDGLSDASERQQNN